MAVQYESNTDWPLSPITADTTIAGAELASLTNPKKYQIAQLLGQPSKSIVKFDGTSYTVTDGTTGLIVAGDVSNGDAAINTGLGNLTGSRAYKEKITLVGRFTDITESIELDDYTILDMSAAQLIPATWSTLTVEQAIIRNTNWLLTHDGTNNNVHIDVIGGYIDGLGTFSTDKAISNIFFSNIEHLTVWGVHTYRAREHGIVVDYGSNITIGYNKCEAAGDDGITAHWSANEMLIIGNECYDGLVATGSPSGGSRNGIELENELNGDFPSSPKNVMIAYNRCWNNVRGILAKDDGGSGEDAATEYLGIHFNVCWDNSNEGIRITAVGTDDPTNTNIIGLDIDGNILFNNGHINNASGMFIRNANGATIRGGSIRGSGTNGIELLDCESTQIGGGITIAGNDDNGIRGNTTVTNTSIGEVFLYNNADSGSFSYGVDLEGDGTYISPLAIFKNDLGIPGSGQLGIKMYITCTNMRIDGPLFNGYKQGGSTRQGPIFFPDNLNVPPAALPAGLLVRECRTLNEPNSAIFKTENSGKATKTTGQTIPHGLNLQADTGTYATVIDSLNKLNITVMSGSYTDMRVAVDETDITLTFSGGNSLDVLWEIAAQKWAV